MSTPTPPNCPLLCLLRRDELEVVFSKLAVEERVAVLPAVCSHFRSLLQQSRLDSTVHLQLGRRMPSSRGGSGSASCADQRLASLALWIQKQRSCRGDGSLGTGTLDALSLDLSCAAHPAGLPSEAQLAAVLQAPAGTGSLQRLELQWPGGLRLQLLAGCTALTSLRVTAQAAAAGASDLGSSAVTSSSASGDSDTAALAGMVRLQELGLCITGSHGDGAAEPSSRCSSWAQLQLPPGLVRLTYVCPLALEVPPAILTHPGLESLHLDLPAMKEPGLVQLSSLTRLRALALRADAAGSVPAGALRPLLALTRLSLRGARLAQLPADLGELPQLGALHLDCGRLEALPGCVLELGHSLTQLSLACKGPEVLHLPPGVSALSALRHLRLRCRQLGPLPQELSCLRELRSLYLAGNGTQDCLVGLEAALQGLRQLEHLSVVETGLLEAPVSLEGMYCLKSLHLSGCKRLPPSADLSSITSLTMDARSFLRGDHRLLLGGPHLRSLFLLSTCLHADCTALLAEAYQKIKAVQRAGQACSSSSSSSSGSGSSSGGGSGGSCSSAKLTSPFGSPVKQPPGLAGEAREEQEEWAAHVQALTASALQRGQAPSTLQALAQLLSGLDAPAALASLQATSAARRGSGSGNSSKGQEGCGSSGGSREPVKVYVVGCSFREFDAAVEAAVRGAAAAPASASPPKHNVMGRAGMQPQPQPQPQPVSGGLLGGVPVEALSLEHYLGLLQGQCASSRARA